MRGRDQATPFDAPLGGDGNLKAKSVRSGALMVAAQWAKLVLQTGSGMILARILAPADYGMVGMVSAIMGFAVMFKDAGLSLATVQRERITREQISTLFWVNVGLSFVLMLLLMGAAPLIAGFYRERQLVWVTIALAAGLGFGGLTVQHSALLNRQMRFNTITAIDMLSQFIAILVGIATALQGLRHWALVCMALTGPLVTAAGSWMAVRWIPGRPRRHCGVGSMLRFGGNSTALNVLNYLARNVDGILIGRACGADALGVYGRAYQILLLPINQINSPIGSVAIPTLAKLQRDRERFRRYFLAGYLGVVSVFVPVVLVCALYAEEIVLVLLGPQWHEASSVFRLLIPAALAGALMNPLGWMLAALGRADRHLKVALMVNPVIILSFAAGLAFGVRGVAGCYSVAMVLLTLPVFYLMTRGTGVLVTDLLGVIRGPLIAAAAAGVAGWAVRTAVADRLLPIARVAVGSTALFGVYGLILLVAMGQRERYLEIWRQLAPARFQQRSTKA